MILLQEPQQAYFNHQAQQSLSGPLMVDLVRGVLARGCPFRFRAGGASMFPFIRDGDVISIDPLPARGPNLGDVVAFSLGDGSRLVVHRVVAKTGAGWRIQGDNYSPGHFDGPISAQCLLGRVSRVERSGHPIRLGLGPERRLIALLSRWGLLQPLFRRAAALYRRLK